MKFSKLDKAASKGAFKAMQDYLEEATKKYQIVFDIMMAVKSNNEDIYIKKMSELIAIVDKEQLPINHLDLWQLLLTYDHLTEGMK